jgi:hypothetical protein
MKKTKEEALEGFLDNEEQSKKPENGNIDKKEVVMKEREGLIERVDPIYVTKNGKQLLREQY